MSEQILVGRELDKAVAYALDWRRWMFKFKSKPNADWSPWFWQPPTWNVEDDFVLERVELRHATKDDKDTVDSDRYLPHFSTNISDAWHLVYTLHSDGWLVAVKVMPEFASYTIEGSRSEYDAPCEDIQIGKGKVCCEITDMKETNTFPRLNQWCFANTAPEAICRVLLKAKEN